MHLIFPFNSIQACTLHHVANTRNQLACWRPLWCRFVGVWSLLAFRNHRADAIYSVSYAEGLHDRQRKQRVRDVKQSVLRLWLMTIA